RPRQSPLVRVLGEMALHVFMYELLQIDSGVTERANDDIAANTGLERHVTVRIRDLFVAAVVIARLADLRVRAGDDVVHAPRERTRRDEKSNRNDARHLISARTPIVVVAAGTPFAATSSVSFSTPAFAFAPSTVTVI